MLPDDREAVHRHHGVLFGWLEPWMSGRFDKCPDSGDDAAGPVHGAVLGDGDELLTDLREMSGVLFLIDAESELRRQFGHMPGSGFLSAYC
ncbi:hypothetical protein AB0N93_16060 [Streptomyces sp. NPDC091267]|uniref:hypothetical protein n=1 Tax=Streptomyces sp. NPDC091267 TaxID=3155195 RepID=UPI003420A53C